MSDVVFTGWTAVHDQSNNQLQVSGVCEIGGGGFIVTLKLGNPGFNPTTGERVLDLRLVATGESDSVQEAYYAEAWDQEDPVSGVTINVLQGPSPGRLEVTEARTLLITEGHHACTWGLEDFSVTVVDEGPPRRIRVQGKGVCPESGYSVGLEAVDPGMYPDPAQLVLGLVELASPIRTEVLSPVVIDQIFKVPQAVVEVAIRFLGVLKVQDQQG